ncbi:MAG: glycosyltransferase family 9 protein [Candidatus Omnitrophica bacterium]|nr:glycosyltransferase family 9 protein [Candidatus Omnitrophota bacterium]
MIDQNKTSRERSFYSTKSSWFKSALKNLYFSLRSLTLTLVFRTRKAAIIRQEDVLSIVVIRIDRIGDLVVSFPAIKALKEIFPRSRLAVMVRPQLMPLLKNTPWIDERISYNGFLNSIAILRRKHFYLAVDLLIDYPLKTAWLCFFSGARLRLGFDIAGRGRLFNLSLRPSRKEQRLGEHTLELVKFLGSVLGVSQEKIPTSDSCILFSREDKEFAEEFLRVRGIKSDDLIIGIHPGGQFPSQHWILGRFAALADEIYQKHRAKILILGNSNEKELVDKLSSLMKIKPILTVGLSLNKLAAIIAHFDILVCNNSGLLHIAAALEIPTVSTMGPTHPQLWSPKGDNHIVLRKELACSPCNRPVCARHDCMKLITVDEVLSGVENQISKIENAKVS